MDIADHIRRDPEEGARRLVSELGPSLYGVALRLVGDDRAAADDLYMRALECAFAKIVQYRGDGLFPWLRAILVNIRRMDLRRRGRDLRHRAGNSVHVGPAAAAGLCHGPGPEMADIGGFCLLLY